MKPQDIADLKQLVEFLKEHQMLSLIWTVAPEDPAQIQPA